MFTSASFARQCSVARPAAGLRTGKRATQKRGVQASVFGLGGATATGGMYDIAVKVRELRFCVSQRMLHATSFWSTYREMATPAGAAGSWSDVLEVLARIKHPSLLAAACRCFLSYSDRVCTATESTLE